jgi:hypothetical protein
MAPAACPPTSPEQRRKVAHLRCLVCGRVPVDPAHLVPRALGGCASADCVIPLCRGHHRLYDDGVQILAPFLRPELERELRHALTHVGCAELEAAMTRGGWQVAVEVVSTGGRDRASP